MDYQTATVQTNGFTMDYLRFGQGKETLVILPGLSVQRVLPSASAIVQAYRALTDDFTVYLFERRNELPDPYPIQQMADDTYAAMQTLGLNDVCLFGASQGGMIAMTIACTYPSFVKKLILGSTACLITDAQYAAIEHWVQAAKNGETESLYLAFGEAIYPQELFRQYQRVLLTMAKSVTEEDLSRFIVLAEAVRDFDVSDRLSKITCPVLILGAKDDCVLGTDAASFLVNRMDGHAALEFHLYDGYGHAAYDTAPDYRTRMLRFLRK